MAESIIFSFTKIDDFFEVMIDSEINTALFDGVNPNFKIVLAESCPNNIDECIDSNYQLNTDEMTLIEGSDDEGECALSWNKGVNANRTITIASNSIVYNLDDNETRALKGAFLVVNEGNASGTVLAYSINNAPIIVKNQIIMPVDGMIWTIHSVLE